MSKEKQIEEMADKVTYSSERQRRGEYVRRIVEAINYRGENDHENLWSILYDFEIEITAGYRKQSENNIELPCKIGDTVYIIDEADDECGEDYVLAVKVLQFFINEHGIGIDLALPLGMRLNTWMVVGENVFLTEEEAEKALAKMKGSAE